MVLEIAAEYNLSLQLVIFIVPYNIDFNAEGRIAQPVRARH